MPAADVASVSSKRRACAPRGGGAEREAVGADRIRPLEGWKGLWRVLRDPDDTHAVFSVLDAFDGPFLEGWFRRFRATRVGRRVLEEDRDLLSLLTDRAWLTKMPDGSLGRAYAEFMRAENLSTEAVVAAGGTGVGPGYEGWHDEGRARFSARLRDQHDLEHVVTGYGRDGTGETALLAFELGQSITPGLLLVVAARLRHVPPAERGVLLEAYRRGRRAAWLPATDWEGLLELALSDVRAILGVGEPVGRTAPDEQRIVAA